MAPSLTPLRDHRDFRIGNILRESWRLFSAHPITYLIVIAAFVALIAYFLRRVPSFPSGGFLSPAQVGMAATGVFVSATIAAISIGVAATAAQDKPSLLSMILSPFRANRMAHALVGIGGCLPFIVLIAADNAPGPVLSLAAVVIFITASTYFWSLIPVLAVEQAGLWRGAQRALSLSRGYLSRILALEVVLLVPGLALGAAVRLMIARRVDPSVVFGIGWGLFALWLLVVSLAMVVSFFILRALTDERDPEPIARVFD